MISCFASSSWEESLREDVRSDRKKLDVEEFVGVGIDRGIQQEPLIVEMDHGLVDRDVTQAPIEDQMKVGFLHPVWTVEQTRSMPNWSGTETASDE